MFTLGKAAKETGLSKTTISKAIKSGRLLASRTDDGQYRIDPDELFRVYPQVDRKDDGSVYPIDTPSNLIEVTRLQAENLYLKETVTRLEGDRDWLRGQLDMQQGVAQSLTRQLESLSPSIQATPTKPRKLMWLGVGLLLIVGVVASLYALNHLGELQASIH